MGVTEDIGIIRYAAETYSKRLCGRKVLFIPNDRTRPLEVTFLAENFMHLCGVSYPVNRKRDFLTIAEQGRIDSRKLEYTYDRMTDAKLSVLGILMHIDAKASMFVTHPALPGNTKADCVAVNDNAILGFVEHRRRLVPGTALRLDRQWEDPHMILAIAKTEPDEDDYTIICKEPKGRKKTSERMRRIVSSLKQYDGLSDTSWLMDYFASIPPVDEHSSSLRPI